MSSVDNVSINSSEKLTPRSEISAKIWNNFTAGPRDKKTHRRSATCLYCSALLKSSRIETLYNHVVKVCNKTPPEIFSAVTSISLSSIASRNDIEASARSCDVMQSSSKLELIWDHFSRSARDPKSHRRSASCLHCTKVFVCGREHLLREHIVRICSNISEDARQKFCFAVENPQKALKPILESVPNPNSQKSSTSRRKRKLHVSLSLDGEVGIDPPDASKAMHAHHFPSNADFTSMHVSVLAEMDCTSDSSREGAVGISSHRLIEFS